MDKINAFLTFQLIHIGTYTISVYDLLFIIAIISATKLILFLIRKALYRNHHLNQQNVGNTYALYQLIKYLIWIIALAIILETIGVRISLLLAGSAALLVGIGLGLQQTFNDIVSGIILLAERSIKVDDILEIDGDIVKIKEIGLRTSSGINRDEISIIIPNSLITTNKVINWSHQTNQARFRITLGIAYGSNLELAVKVLTGCVRNHPDVTTNKVIDVRLVDFSNSSINLQVLFYSETIFRIEKVKSDIRMEIHAKFKENNISIPFPQMDLHLDGGISLGGPGLNPLQPGQ